MSAWNSLTHAFKNAVGSALERKQSEGTGQRRRRSSGMLKKRPPKPRAMRTSPDLSHDYPGDFSGPLTMEYAPLRDDQPDPGEVVWTWVPYEEDHAKGKDRPVLLIGRDGEWLLGLPLTSKDHDRDAAQEASQGRYWVDIGSGAWDSRGRESEARVDRIIRVNPGTVRREGAQVSREVFDEVAAGVRRRRKS